MQLASQTVDDRLNELVPEGDAPLWGARYALFSGGKRFRPQLTLAICPDALDAACAVEMIHTFSLIHDDLPCMDDDALRRGKPTLHTVIDEGQALLAGSYLQTRAFEVIANSAYTDRQKAELISALSYATGEMIYGQCLDLGAPLTEDSIETLHIAKTASLMQAALICGGILSGDDLDLLSDIGHHLGLAYQYFDDIADGDTQIFGEQTIDKARHHHQISLELSKDFPDLHTLIKDVF